MPNAVCLNACVTMAANMKIFTLGLFNTKGVFRVIHLSRCAFSDKVPDSAIPKPSGTEFYKAIDQAENGAIYDKKPFRMTLEKGKTYAWCLCGKSKSQPLCDGTHRLSVLKIKQKPIKFHVNETKEYWLCNCKQTSHRPFCDGTHKEDRIQTAVK